MYLFVLFIYFCLEDFCACLEVSHANVAWFLYNWDVLIIFVMSEYS